MNGISAGEESPWHSREGLPGQSCEPQSVDVKYEFKICNQNYELEIELDQTQSWMRFRDIEVKFSHAKVLPRQCRSQVLYRTLDLCDVNSNDRRRYPMSVQLDGRVDMPGDDNHCYCKYYVQKIALCKNYQFELITSLLCTKPNTYNFLTSPSFHLLLIRLHLQEIDLRMESSCCS